MSLKHHSPLSLYQLLYWILHFLSFLFSIIRSCGGSLFSPWCSHLPNAKAGELWNSGGIQLKVESESSFIC
ncbi:hypothetical protein AOLI_G00136930 [Acnodon oligacanthus]